MSITIRPIRLADAAGYNACMDVVARERRYLAMIQAPAMANTVRFIEIMLKNDWPLFVAEAPGKIEGAIVGWCYIGAMTGPGAAHCGILGMGLLPQQRGQGLGRSLAEAALAKAPAVGLERVQLDVYADNAGAIALYEKLGFVHEGKRRRARKLDGVYTDVVMMARLTPPLGK